jgi:hypothetical protein
VQIYEPIARADMDPVGQNEVIAASDDLNTEKASGTARIFDDPLVQTQTDVKRFHYRT